MSDIEEPRERLVLTDADVAALQDLLDNRDLPRGSMGEMLRWMIGNYLINQPHREGPLDDDRGDAVAG